MRNSPRRDDGAGSRFPFDPANFSPLAKRSEKPLFLFDVEGPCVHDLQIGAAMAGKALSLGKHTGKCRRKCRSDTHVLVIHHSTNVGHFFPRATSCGEGF